MRYIRLICLVFGMAGLWYVMPAIANGEDAASGGDVVEYAQGAEAEAARVEDVHGEDAHAGDEEAHGGGHAGASAGNPISVDPDLMIFTAIIFLVLLAVLRKFAWGPIRDALDDREKAISNQIAAAERQNQEARQLLADHETRLASAADEVRTLLDEGRREAELQKQRIVAEAEQAAAAEKDRALLAIEAAIWAVAPASVLGATALSLLELFVAFLQAYIFTFLSALFIGMAVHEH